MTSNILKEIFAKSISYQKLAKTILENNQIYIKGLYGSSRALILALLFENGYKNFLYILPNDDEAESVKDDLELLLGENFVSYFPDQKDRPYELNFRDNYRKKMLQEALEKICNGQRFIVVTTAKAISKKILASVYFKKQSIKVNQGEKSDFEILKSLLINFGFSREVMVENGGEMSVRGGIIDILPFSFKNPIRIEFFGDVIESIREFDLFTQRSIREIPKIIIYPQFPEDEAINGNSEMVSLFNYFNDKDTIIVLEDAVFISKEIEQKFEDAEFLFNLKIEKEEVLPPQNYYLNWDSFQNELAKFAHIDINNSLSPTKDIIDFGILLQERLRGNFHILKSKISHYSGLHINNIHFLCESADQCDRFKEIMLDEGINVDSIHFYSYPLTQGFIFPEMALAILTDSQFYGRIRRGSIRKQYFSGLSIHQFKSLSNGDYVVHVDLGIGKYVGLKKISVNGTERECLTIEYKDGDLVYVPLEKMKRVQKYSAKEGIVPQISKLGSADWEKLKKRTKKKVKNIARELIHLYALRKSQKAHAFSKDTHWQRELEASFAYEETTDQSKAIAEIKNDMENQNPMDRLVCGDVGYGKTEVALRAAFKAVNDNKQVAILVPTTILALQHYNTFKERLKNYPVKIEMLSRFRSRAEQCKIIELLKQGNVDIIIGTHRLLSKDVSFKDLGLIIVDEEQRFGVQNKEKLKQLKVNVDVLTLTATPIPRTLNMALMGVRDLSLINTPPLGRLSIYTEVIPFDRQLIRMSILKEIERGGQVFFVHNRVQSIMAIYDLLSKLVPEASFVVAHGQMDEKDLERVMWAFASNKYDCLISTMIIESGLDIPNVNTLIINRADRFGLSQLYQLRGRVGRSNQRAYAYLISPPIKHLTSTALKRLRTIEEFTELGSGFQIAMRDLQIRGAGNILGGEQSGFIVSLGSELYFKILEDAIKELKYEQGGQLLQEKENLPETKVDLNVDAYIPDYYILQPETRVHFYKKMVELSDYKQVLEIENEMRDRFGKLPVEAKNLLYLVEMKLLGTQLELKRVKIVSNEMYIQFCIDGKLSSQELIQQRLVSIVNKTSNAATFIQTGENELGMKVQLPKQLNDQLNAARNFLQSLI